MKTAPVISDLKKLEKISKEIGINEFYIVGRKYADKLDRVIYGFAL